MPDFSIYHELMAFRVREVLLVHTPFDAFIMGGANLTGRIARQYRGLNLSRPPRLTAVQDPGEALAFLDRGRCDLVLTMPQAAGMDGVALARRIRDRHPALPVVMLAHNPSGLPPDLLRANGPLEQVYRWSSNPDLLLAIIKNVEDRRNAEHDTAAAQVGVILLVEDDPADLSLLLPPIYQEVVRQTQAVLDESLNDEHRLLKMRARPKILTATNFQEAMALYRRFQPYLLAVIADSRFPAGGRPSAEAGPRLLAKIRSGFPDLPLLLTSAETANRQTAEAIAAGFLDKNDPDLPARLAEFFRHHLGFGDFVFRLPDGREIGRADNLIAFERALRDLPEPSLRYHAQRGHFVTWIMARSEIPLANRLRRAPTRAPTETLRRFLCQTVYAELKERQRGVMSRFSRRDFDAKLMDFVLCGEGEVGGKGLGLAFLARYGREEQAFDRQGLLPVEVPPTVILATGFFTQFMAQNFCGDELAGLADHEIDQRFLAAELPAPLRDDLAVLLEQIRHPCIVRSSSTLEDAHLAPYAGLFRTCVIANQGNLEQRLAVLSKAVKLVYASAFHRAPRSFSASVGERRPGAMAVMIQKLVGQRRGDLFYPTIAGVAQSYNDYPVGPMRPEDGIVHCCLGLGATVVAGEPHLRFSPRHPRVLPQFTAPADILACQQRYLHALRLDRPQDSEALRQRGGMERLPIATVAGLPEHAPLFSRYLPDEETIRDTGSGGVPVLTFAGILKHQLLPLPESLSALLELGRRGMGCEVEMEFALETTPSPHLAVLQIRPLVRGGPRARVTITDNDRRRALCHTTLALGRGRHADISDILLVRPDRFNRAASRDIAREIGMLNAQVKAAGRRHLLIGPGRWGSADPWLGIPVNWQEIDRAAAIVEICGGSSGVAPSHGTHFFHNLTALGIPYLTVRQGTDLLDLDRFASLPQRTATEHCALLAATPPLTVLVADGEGVVTQNANNEGQHAP